MSKPIKVFCKLLTAAAYFVLVACVIYVIASWSNISDTVGMHFAADGSFDLYRSKNVAFYHPFTADALLLILLEIFGFLTKRLKPGIKINERGAAIIKTAILIYLNVIKLSVSAFFAHWIDCVVRQKWLNTSFAVAIIFIFAAGFIAVLIIGVAVRIKHSTKEGEVV